MANSDKNIVITPNIGQTAQPSIVFTGQDAQDITLSVLDSAGLSISGASGQLFSVIDDATGTIFSVNDISGIPSLEVDDDGTIRLAEFAGNVLIGTATDNGTDLLQVDGSGLFNAGDTVYGMNSTPSLTLGVNTTAAGTLKLWGGTSGSYSLIQQTTNNLHIDTVGGDTYLNFYDGNAVRFGNGAGAVVAVMGPDGDLWKGSADNTGSRYFHDGYHPNADTLTTARTISLGGVLSGSASFNGSGNITITAAHTSDPVITLTGAVTGSGTMTNLGSVSIATTATADPTLTLAGDASGSATFTNLGNATLTVTVADDSHEHTRLASATAGNDPDSTLEYFQLSGNTNIHPTTDWYNSIRMGHGDPVTYYSNTLAVKMTGTNVGDIYTRTIMNGTAQSWNRFWHSNNDGSGSGLDADLLDGQHGSYYQPVSSDIMQYRGTINSQDWNTFVDGTEAGFYGVANMTGSNKPPTYTYGLALSASVSGQGKFQLYAPHNGSEGGNGLYYRSGWNTDYDAWAEIWHSNNDGSGSGLDADLLDGREGNSFFQLDVGNSGTFNLNVSGTHAWGKFSQGAWTNTPYAGNYSHVLSFNANPTDNRTVQLYMGDVPGAIWWRMNQGGTQHGWERIWTASNDGSGSGLDADLLDGLQGSSFLRSDAANSVDVRLAAASGRGLRFWDSDNYKIWMSYALDATWGGRLDSTSDYNMYFRMTGGTNRGFVFQNSSTEVFQIEGNGNITSTGDINSTSDIRVKDNIEVIENAVDKLKQIRGVTFTRTDKEDTERRYTGVIAQEVQAVLPEVIGGDEDNLTVAYGNMVGLLVEGIKEQDNIINTMRTEIDELKALVHKLIGDK